MFVSLASLQIFVGLNSLLLSLAYLQNIFIHYSLFFTIVARNYFLLYFVTAMSSRKEFIKGEVECVEDYKYEFDVNVLTSAVMETISCSVLYAYYPFNPDSGYDVIYFIPLSFAFELVFDFFHYMGHRMLHNKYLYKYIHKKHHKFEYPTAIITFYQDPLDILITNVLPALFTLCIIPTMSSFQFNAIIVYKTYSEIGGHISKKCAPTSSFCQFIWLPKWLHIELYTENHSLHHSLHNCNYSKRFSLWDKVFGTFTPELH